MTNKLTIAFTRREAELYRSHGLLEEARQLYRQVMDEAGTLGPSLAESLQEKIRKLEDELAELEVDLTDVVSERELCILRDGWGDAQSPSEISTCASALGSIGLYEASIEEYRKLIRLNQPFAEYIVGFTDSLLAVYTPETIKGEIDAIIDSDQPEEAHPIGLRIAFAMELSRRGLDRPALALYEAAQAIKPLPKKIDALVTALQKRLQTKEAQAPETKLSPVSEKPGHQLRIRLAHRLARLRGLIRRLRKS
jgi:tetratricopeptide (TPR) repeat protein